MRAPMPKLGELRGMPGSHAPISVVINGTTGTEQSANDDHIVVVFPMPDKPETRERLR